MRKQKDIVIAERLFLLPEFLSANIIFLFASFRSEVNTFGMMMRALEAGKKILLPKVEGKNLGLYEIRSPDELVPGYMNIPEPSVLSDERKMAVNDADLIIIPGAAFDNKGNRIGYGGGFYDRLLAGLQKPVPVIAPIYDEQLVEHVPAEEHDKRVDVIVTDLRIIRCN